VKLTRLVEIDSVPTVHDLTGLWGDRYLLAKNPIYARVRELTLAAHFQFSDELRLAMIALPLSQLEIFLDQRVIPYIDNVRTLKQVTASLGRDLDWDDVRDGLYRNHVFHESAHAVFRNEIPKDLRLPQAARILRVLLEESFANACEMFAMKDVDDTAHQIFYEHNSYFFVPEIRAGLTKISAEWSPSGVFGYLWLCYLHSNFLQDEVTDAETDQILALLPKLIPGIPKLPAGTRKVLRAVGKVCFELNPRFRENTTGLHLQLLGFRGGTRKNLGFDFMAELTKDTDLQQKFRALIQKLFR
jgi:hypothetical protein